jgi:hypothetical protein
MKICRIDRADDGGGPTRGVRVPHGRVTACGGDEDQQERQRDRHPRSPVGTKAGSLVTRNVWPSLVTAVATRDRTTLGPAPGDRDRAPAGHSDAKAGRSDDGLDGRRGGPVRHDSRPDCDRLTHAPLNRVSCDYVRRRCVGPVTPSRHRGAGRGSTPAARSERAIVSHRGPTVGATPDRTASYPGSNGSVDRSGLLIDARCPPG